MLQSLLQPRDNQRSKMIGAMPAVAVRHERRRAEKRAGRRASTLPGRDDDAEVGGPCVRAELYKILKLTALYGVVCCSLLGIVFLVVGLVQLSPRAEAAQHRYSLMGTGGTMLALAVSLSLLRCAGIHWYKRQFEEEDDVSEQGAHQNGVADRHGHVDHKTGQVNHKTGHNDNKTGHNDHKTGHNDQKTGHNDHKADHKTANEKPKLKTQASVGRDLDLAKQPSAASDT
ncbi:uncharacterized protein LOC106713843 isoform X2 [Papilio machaon]|uniref:uncharacterized protein LOC106713843 isoform X2 n=1 Tax=Papilio machaon TaxID=76193 RepID=UPI001E66556E|nr:uncharacterized protein LOC106713843 isoform X2 [Papilio machaon]